MIQTNKSLLEGFWLACRFYFFYRVDGVHFHKHGAEGFNCHFQRTLEVYYLLGQA